MWCNILYKIVLRKHQLWICGVTSDFLRKLFDYECTVLLRFSQELGESVGPLFNVLLYPLILTSFPKAAHGHGLISSICTIHRVNTKFCFAINSKCILPTGGYGLLYYCQFLSEGIVQAKWSQATICRPLRNTAIKRFSDYDKLTPYKIQCAV